VESDAISAKGIAAINNQNSFMAIVAVSCVAGFYFVLLMFLVWRWFKHNYVKRLRDSKPEVTQQ
jgi:hypothetical protein